jgi:recombination protein RecA
MNPLYEAIQKINDKYKAQLITEGTSRIYVDRIPFSSPRLNYMTYGGVPLGKATELLGAEGGGKTTTALDIVAQAQKKAMQEFEEQRKPIADRIAELEAKQQEKELSKTDQKELKKLQEELAELDELGPRRCVYVDAENTLDEEWAEKIGVDLESLILVRLEDQTAEQALQIILDLIATGQVICLVLDSIPMLVSQKVYDESLEKKSYGGIADAMSTFCPKVSPLISKHKTALVMINQIREDMDNPHNMYKTPAGRALRHLYSLRLFFRRGALLDDKYNEIPQRSELAYGHIVDVSLVKTKICRPDRRTTQYTLMYDIGFDVANDLLFMAIKYGLIAVRGSYYYILNEDGEILMNGDEELKFQGKANILQFLREDEEIFEELWNKVNERLMEAS